MAEEVVTPDDRRFRDVMGYFATGVTIITAMDGDEPVGMAANSFTSLSLDPPLILFCVAHTSSTWPRIEQAGTFAVNILGEDHEELSQLFAAKAADPSSSSRVATSAWTKADVTANDVALAARVVVAIILVASGVGKLLAL